LFKLGDRELEMQFQPDRTMQETVSNGVVDVGLPVCVRAE
jgi:hypothetical protein